MTEEHYRELFQDLGILADERMNYVLKIHGQPMALYFNELKTSIGVYFVSNLDYWCRYPDRLWDRIDETLVAKRNRRQNGYFPIVPRHCFERRAFEDLLTRL